MNFKILRFETISSTNDEALKQAKLGADEGICVVADEQTKGRGRHGREWISPKGAGLYFSLVLRPQISPQRLPLLTLISAVAVFDTLHETFGITADIKWANDVLVNDKKICGILAETTETARGFSVILGIGINLKSSNFPPEIADIATSIEAESEIEPKLEILLPNLTKNLEFYYRKLHSTDGDVFTCNEWSKRSSFAFGKLVKVFMPNEIIIGTTRGIELDGALRLEKDSGETVKIYAGDVEKFRRL